MADEDMRLRDVATTWKPKAKTNAKDAKAGRRAQEELDKAKGDITAVLEERDISLSSDGSLWHGTMHSPRSSAEFIETTVLRLKTT